jgi:hypothetical protein
VSYKSIDLQTSLPRVAEMSPLQHHQQQRSATEQSLLGQQLIKDAAHEAKRSVKTDAATNSTISERQPRDRNKQTSNQKKKQSSEQETEESHPSEHPYKGKHIDFMG